MWLHYYTAQLQIIEKRKTSKSRLGNKYNVDTLTWSRQYTWKRRDFKPMPLWLSCKYPNDRRQRHIENAHTITGRQLHSRTGGSMAGKPLVTDHADKNQTTVLLVHWTPAAAHAQEPASAHSHPYSDSSRTRQRADVAGKPAAEPGETSEWSPSQGLLARPRGCWDHSLGRRCKRSL